jgi:GntR family transcriptional regulator
MNRRVPVTPAAGVPLHRQLFLVLHDEIARGALTDGEALPSEQTLSEQFGVSRITVRRALTDLADHGYIERRQGVGSFVRSPQPSIPQPTSGSYRDEMSQIQFETEVEVVEYDVRNAPPAIAEKLGIIGDVLHILRLRRERRTGEPLMVTEAWLPADLADTITDSTLADTALYRILSDAGIKIDRMQHEITAEISGPRNAQLLDTAIGSALLRVTRVAFTGGRIHHLLSILINPNRSRILLELTNGENVSIAHDVGRTAGQPITLSRE